MADSDERQKNGILVSLEGRRGVARLVELSPTEALVEWFHSVGRSETESVSPASIIRARLAEETRVYIESEHGWRVGRVRGIDAASDGTFDYEVRFAKRESGWVNETDLRTRSLEPHDDPTMELAAGCVESQFFFDQRWPLVRCLTDLRSAAAGMSGLTSAAIELIPHQVRAVRRVLQDPIQRYLLADEVGLGKTIEAGVILRQLLLDSPACAIVVTCPTALVGQWKDELSNRFGCTEIEDRVTVVPFDAMTSSLPPPDLLIVDEAHKLVHARADTPRPDWADACWRLAIDADRLLLLSATPPLGEERTLLHLLHLLDPDTHRLDDVDGFKHKVDASQEFGRVLLSLREDASRFVLRRAIKRLGKLAVDDEFCTSLCGELETVLGDEAADPSAAVLRLREHVADTYRVHQRVVRTRRVEVEGLGFNRRGPEGGEDEEPPLPHVREEAPGDEDLVLAMEELRAALVEEADSDESTRVLARSFWNMAAAISIADEDDLRLAVSDIPAGGQVPERAREVVKIALTPERLDDRLDVAVGSLKRLVQVVSREARRPAKVVVFGTAVTLTGRLADRIGSSVPGTEVFVLRDRSPEAARAEVCRFEGSKRPALLIADAAAEEGLNLQFADAMVHLDLPFSVTRIEQRIGRIDRFGRRAGTIRHRVLIPDDEDASPWQAWYQALARGFEVFNRPVSDVQFILPELVATLQVAMLKRGAAGIDDAIPAIRARLKEERVRLDEQAALDHEVERTTGADFVDRVLASEEDEEEIDAAFDGWFRRALQFDRVGDDPAKWDFGRETMLARNPWRARFDAALAPQEVTFKRTCAVKRPSIALVRPGSPLADGAESLLQWDERGTAFATWRQCLSLSDDDGTWVGFRLCFVVEPALGEWTGLQRGEDSHGLRRRVISLFPPFAHSVWVRADMKLEQSDRILRQLEAPLRGDHRIRDTNLVSCWEALEDILGVSRIGDLCREAGRHARELLRADAVYVDRVRAAEQRLQTELSRRERRRSAAAHRVVTPAVVERELRETVLDGLVAESVRAPDIRLDAVGLMVLSRSPPPAGHS